MKHQALFSLKDKKVTSAAMLVCYLKVSTTYRFNIEILSKLLVSKDQCILEQKME